MTSEAIVQTDTILQDGSTLFTEPIRAQANQDAALMICFHGSGSNACSSWGAFISELKSHYRVLLFNRSEAASISVHTDLLLAYLKQREIVGPYILVAHSYGGTFAKQFLVRNPRGVAGMALVETGKAPEPTLAKHRKWDDGRGRLGAKPLAVVTGNSLLWKRKELEATSSGDGTSPDAQDSQRRWLEDAEKEDLRLEKAQLQMSKNAKHFHLPDCRHNVVRDRPDIVLEAVHWVEAEASESKNRFSWKTKFKAFLGS